VLFARIPVGWHTCAAISPNRLGIPGPNGKGTTDGAPFTLGVILRDHGQHKGYRTIFEMDETADEPCMYLVLDAHRNLVGQTFGTSHAACQRKMNAIFKAKGLGVYNSKYVD
jgi:hypothetical protein